MNLESSEINLSPRELHLIKRLKKEFVSRSQRNSSYSLRAFAKSIHIDQSHLTKILAGKVRLSEKMVLHISSLLGIKPNEIMAPQSYSTIEDTTFEIIGSWVPFAIMELIKTSGFRNDPQWIARKLSVHVKEIQI